MAHIDSNTITQIGVGGLFAIFILKMVFDFMKSKNGNGLNEVQELRHEILEKALDKMTKAIDNQTKLLSKMTDQMRELRFSMGKCPHNLTDE